MTRPHKLSTGQCIGVFAPSEPITESRLSKLQRGISILEDQGFTVRLGNHALKQRYYMPGTPKERVDDIHELARSDQVNALMVAWGGKSANQLLTLINYDALSEARKPILGFSDGGVLLNAITAQTGLITFYGPNVVGKLFETKHADLGLLRGGFLHPKNNLLGDTQSVSAKVLRDGQASGRLFGGNLSTFTLGCLNSRFMPTFEPGIFFWESGGERLQIVDQHLTCLRNAGMFDRVGAMIVGDFIHEDKPDYKSRDPFEMILECLDSYTFPVVYCPTFGHPGHLENPIIPVGALCQFSSADMSLTLQEPVVE